ncbi:hypothetical protein JCM5353_003978 [Sporobolomyces roseus]
MTTSNEPPKKKRRLPTLDDSFSSDLRPTDSPALHQGRKRAHPHVQGQWAAHVYLELELDSALRRLLKKAVDASSESFASEDIHFLFDPPPLNTEGRRSDDSLSTLHISLSRPLYIQTNQKVDLRASVAKVANSIVGFSSRYASFGMLENDEKNRRFLAIEIGQGYEQLKNLVRKLDVELDQMRLPTYYENPRFHTSIAWTSIPRPDARLPFEEDDLAKLDASFGQRLRQGEPWVGSIAIKIGQDIHRYTLKG